MLAPPKGCPVCRSDSTEEFLERRSAAVHQNLLMEAVEEARGIPRGRIAMRVCAECGFVWNSAFEPGLLRYGVRYDSDQLGSPAFQRHVEGRVEHLVHARGVRGRRVVEVGCGKGAFLRKLVEYPGAANQGIGFDPSYRGPDSLCDGRLRFERRFYDASAADVAADVVICRHVIEHLSDPMALLRSVRAALRAAPEARVYFETPDAAWILRNRVIWDIFYEHCSLFGAASLATAFEAAGFTVEEVTAQFEGQYLWLEARPGAPRGAAARDPADLPELARAFAAAEARELERWSSEIQRLSRTGAAVLWGAGAKGVTFANLIDPDARLLDCVVDVNPEKQGRFLPGTGHPIVAPERLRAIRPVAAVVLNPNYVAEIERMVAEMGVEATVVDLMGLS